MLKRLTCLVLAIALGMGVFVPVRTMAYDGMSRLEYYTHALTAFVGDRYHFTDFLNDHAATPRPDATYILEAIAYTAAYGMETEHVSDFMGMPGYSVLTGEEGFIEWMVYITQPGLFDMSLEFFPVPGRNSNIQRAVFINGELPFFEANPVEFNRIWVNPYEEVRRDNQGNDLRPTLTEAPEWTTSVVRDGLGIYNEPLSFYFEAGWNTIGLFSQREPMMLRRIILHQNDPVLSYAQVAAGFAGLPRASVATVAPIRIEGEDPARVSSPMLTPQSDTGGPGVQPYSARYIRMNHIGGASWNESGTWIEWEFTVPEDGLYKIAMNTRQNFQRGANAFRRITIDGVVPFSEMEAVGFPFQNGWRVSTLGDDEPYLFWFEAGTTHTIRMESILGAYAPYVREVQGAITRLNEIYRQIVMITGPNPDIFRDYHIGSRLPQLQAAIGQERDMLQAIFASLQEVSVGRGDRNTMIRTLYRLLESLYDDIENIPRRLNRFRENIGALGTWLMLVQEQQLAVDAIYILPADADTPDNGRRWWRQIWHEIVTLVLSFFINYDIIGDVVDGQLRHIEVWIGTGRDQATIIKRLIDDRFTPETGIGVTLRLVDIAMILPATVAGQGPDVTLSIFNSLPMDYGMRGAVRDISGFPYFEEVAARFPEAAMVPYTFRDYVFALPETITFPMLFYRRDILHDIGLTPPDTWDEVRSAIATLALHHMDFGIPMNEDMNGIPFPHFSYGIFLYQMGGEFFIEDGAASGLDSDIALNAFRDFTRFFTDYNLPRVYNFANRFRFGDMPLAIADYTMYNMLQVFAPEIRGLWGFRPVPGTVHPCEESETGYRIDRSVPAGGNAVVMMQQAADPYAAWDFMKWWTSAEIQTQFGREMESLMGSAARHPTANLEAFGQMPWPAQDYRMLSWQFEYIRGIPEVPGGYFNPRQVRNAFFTVVEMQTIAPRDGLVDAVRLINDELRAKRREFGID